MSLLVQCFRLSARCFAANRQSRVGKGTSWPILTRLRLSEYNAKLYLSIVEREQARAKLKWYYAYTFDGETVTVADACQVQNMHE